MRQTWLRTTATAALLGFGLAGTVQAASASTSASLGRFTVSLIDLDPYDGIAPGIGFRDEQSESYAGVHWDYRYATASGLYVPTLAHEANEATWGSGTTGDDGAQAAVTVTGIAAANPYQWTSASGGFAAEFEITPWTALVLTADYALANQNTGGWANGQYVETFANVVMDLSLTTDQGYEFHQALTALHAVDSWSGSRSPGHGTTATGQLRLAYANLSDGTVSGAYVIGAYASANSVVPVPEPGRWALMLAGLAAVGAVARRR